MLYKRRRGQLTTCQLHHIWTFGKAISVFSSFLFYSVSFSHTYAETHKLEKPHMYAEHILNMSNQARVQSYKRRYLQPPTPLKSPKQNYTLCKHSNTLVNINLQHIKPYKQKKFKKYTSNILTHLQLMPRTVFQQLQAGGSSETP